MTGIMSIDAMFPIGRGGDELLHGDRQARAKTAIAIDHDDQPGLVKKPAW